MKKHLGYGGFSYNGNYTGETAKSRARRIKEGWYDKFIKYPGIDIGCGIDPVDENFQLWDAIYGDNDATYMDGIPDEHYQTVFSSHLLEHIAEPVEAVRNWWRILKKSGYLIIVVPHARLYEQKPTLPSNWNRDHKWFWLPSEFELPHTLSLTHIVFEATKVKPCHVRVLDEGYEGFGLERHPGGEYSIELVTQKV